MTSAIHVISPNGRDPYQEFTTKAELTDPRDHPPVNFHAYPAATGGCFTNNVADVINKQGIFLVLLRGRLVNSLKTIKKLKRSGFTVWVSWKETGHHQIASSMERLGVASRLRRCVQLADAIAAPSSAAREFFHRLEVELSTPVIDLPTPYPMDVDAWRSNTDLSERSGIFIGTREFNVASRNHADALQIAADVATRHQVRLSVINPNGSKGEDAVRATVPHLPEPLLNLVEGKRPYRDYLKLIASHRVVFQLDTSGVPGQVAGDCLLTKTPCVGGNGEVESIAFPDICIVGSDIGSRDWRALLDTLLTDDDSHRATVAKSQQLGAAVLSFTAFRKEIDRLTSGAH